MTGKEQYQQRALDFRRPEAEGTPAPRDQNVSPLASVSRSASSRLENDRWSEYRFEIENRERLDLPPISLDEFAAMRDFADGMTVSLDSEQREQPDERTATR